GMTTDGYARWRLILGREAEQGLCGLSGRGSLLDGDQADLDEALEQIYGGEGGKDDKPGKRSAGLGSSAPKLAKWLGDIRRYFTEGGVARDPAGRRREESPRQ